MNEAQKLARAEKRQALIDAGMIDPDEEDPTLGIGGEEKPIIEEESKRSDVFGDTKPTETSNTSNLAGVSVANMSAHLLALPGIR